MRECVNVRGMWLYLPSDQRLPARPGLVDDVLGRARFVVLALVDDNLALVRCGILHRLALALHLGLLRLLLIFLRLLLRRGLVVLGFLLGSGLGSSCICICLGCGGRLGILLLRSWLLVRLLLLLLSRRYLLLLLLFGTGGAIQERLCDETDDRSREKRGNQRAVYEVRPGVPACIGRWDVAEGLR